MVAAPLIIVHSGSRVVRLVVRKWFEGAHPVEEVVVEEEVEHFAVV